MFRVGGSCNFPILCAHFLCSPLPVMVTSLYEGKSQLRVDKARITGNIFLHNLVSRSRNRPKSIVYRIIIANYTLCIFITEKICVSYTIFYSSRNVIVTDEGLRHLGLCSASVLVFHSIDPDPVNLQ